MTIDLALPRATPFTAAAGRAVAPAEPHAWGWCVARYASLAGVSLDADDALLLGSALGVELWGPEGPSAPPHEPAADGYALLGTRPRAFDTLASVLGTPLLRFGGDPGVQMELLRTRASLGRPTLLSVRASLIPAICGSPEGTWPARNTPLLVLAEPIADDAGPVIDRVTLRAGPTVQVVRTWDEIVAGWERARADAGSVSGPTDEWYVWVPAGVARGAHAWGAVLPLALTQQAAELAPPSAAAPTGVALLRALRADAASSPDAPSDRLAWHRALLRQGGGAGRAYGAAAARLGVARAVARRADDGLPNARALRSLRALADALVWSAAAWDAAAVSRRLDRRARVCEHYDRLLAAETQVVWALGSALRSAHQ
jgi:hypothetical protein